MSWKNSDPQLNLIHILPAETEKSNGKSSHDNSQHLRIKVGDETPSVGIEFFENTIRRIRQGFHKLNDMVSAGVSLGQRGGKGIGIGLTFVFTGLGIVFKKTGKWSAHFVGRLGSSVHQLSLKLGKVLTIKMKRPNRRTHILPSSIDQESIEHSTKLERDELLWEVHALRDQLTAQRNELTRVNVQIGELKALALSQQQVLLHLGQEIESIESKTVRSEKAAPKKVKARSTRASKSKPLPSSPQSTPDASLSLNPRR